MKRPSIVDEILIEFNRVKKNNPSWPDHPAAQAGRVTNKAGVLMHKALKWKYERKKSSDGQNEQTEGMRRAAIHTVIEALRFLENL